MSPTGSIDEYPGARGFFGFSASEAARCLPEGVECSSAKIAEVTMILCAREARTKVRIARSEGFDAGIAWAVAWLLAVRMGKSMKHQELLTIASRELERAAKERER